MNRTTPFFICGPCVAESESLLMNTAEELKKISEKLGVRVVFKSSYDKANRTALSSRRGPGMDEALKMLERVKNTYSLEILTDVHESIQVKSVAEVADILQIPAFLSRQTDLIWAAAGTGKKINIKKGQFMAPEDMQYAVEKAHKGGASEVWQTERGSSFGYHDLVVDFRGLPVMKQFGPVVFDATHSVQKPAGAGGVSGGNREMAIYLAKAAAAVGVDGFFAETHPDPDQAWSDGPNMIHLHKMEEFISEILRIHFASEN